MGETRNATKRRVRGEGKGEEKGCTPTLKKKWWGNAGKEL